jgi:hypothetical protein
VKSKHASPKAKEESIPKKPEKKFSKLEPIVVAGRMDDAMKIDEVSYDPGSNTLQNNNQRSPISLSESLAGHA